MTPRLRAKPKPARLDRPVTVLRSDKHLRFVRRKACVVAGCDSRQVEAAHVRAGLPKGEAGGIGLKPADNWCVPLCRDHHAEQHQHGEATFARKYGLKLVTLAISYALQSTDMAIRDKAQQLRSIE